MSHIKITLNQKEYGLKFNQLAIELISMYSDSSTTTGFVYSMIYGGMRGHSYVNRQEPDYTFEQVCDWIDEIEAAEKSQMVEDVSKVLTDTQVWKTLIKKGEEIINEGEKKKA